MGFSVLADHGQSGSRLVLGGRLAAASTKNRPREPVNGPNCARAVTSQRGGEKRVDGPATFTRELLHLGARGYRVPTSSRCSGELPAIHHLAASIAAISQSLTFLVRNPAFFGLRGRRNPLFVPGEAGRTSTCAGPRVLLDPSPLPLPSPAQAYFL